MNPRLLVAGVVAAVTVTAAVTVVTQDRSTTIKRITDATAEAPGVAWTVTASDTGLEGAVFADPREGSMYAWGSGSIRIDDTVFTLAVVPSDSMAAEAVMVALDAKSGEIRWTEPASELAACAEEPLDGQLVCHRPSWAQEPGLVTFDLESGQSERKESAPYMFAAAVANDRLYTAEGDLEDADVRIHRGSLENYDEDWSESLYVWAGWEDRYADQLKVGADVGYFDLGGGFATFDADTGEEIWSTDTLDDCMTASYRTAGGLAVGVEHRCEPPYEPTATTAFAADGRTIATTMSAPDTYIPIDDPTDPTVPIILGDTAFDRDSGNELWRDESLVYTQPATEWSEEAQRSALTAVIGDVGILTRDDDRIGIDLRNGETLWASTETWSVFAHVGPTVLATDQVDMIALDARSGRILWSAPLDNITPGTRLSTLVDGGNGSYLMQSEVALTLLAPLP